MSSRFFVRYIGRSGIYTLLPYLIVACGGGSNPGTNPPDQDPPPLAADQAQTSEGVYQGSVEGNLLVFRGVRYAAAPVGDLRFKAPAPPATFAGTADATQFESKCIQSSDTGPIGEEDCLFLNIWSHNDDIERPVLVFLHGGFRNGAGGDLATTDGARLAENSDIVVVTLNRRLGVFGGLALDELLQENPRSTAGNYAVLDVIAALAWLKDNLAAFNGDPNRVLLAGESAGAFALCHIVAAPEAAGLISAAAIQSGNCSRRTRLSESVSMATFFDTALNLHRPILVTTGCDVAADILQCLRDLPTADLLTAEQLINANTGRNIFGPIVDGVVVVSDPHTALMAETIGSIPIIVGATADEGANGQSGTPPANDFVYRARLTAIFDSPGGDQIYALYPTASFPSVADAWITFWSDWIINCEAEELARSASGNTPAYLYTFSRGFSTGSLAGLGAVHAIDVPFLFETYDVFGHTPDADDALVTDAMQNAWAGLASDPTAAPPYLPAVASSWPPFDINNVQLVNFDAAVTVDLVHREGRCSSLRDIILL